MYQKDLKKEEGKKEVILMLDDVFDRVDSSEIMTWIYDADFEFLNDDSISRIIISGVRCADYKLKEKDQIPVINKSQLIHYKS